MRKAILTSGVVLVIIVVGFFTLLPIVPLACPAASTRTGTMVYSYETVQTTATSYTRTTTLFLQQQLSSSSTSLVSISQHVVSPGKFITQELILDREANVILYWNASSTVDVFFFTASQLANYQSNGTANAVFGVVNKQTDQTSFNVSSGGEYYLVIANNDNATQAVSVYNASLAANYPSTVTTSTQETEVVRDTYQTLTVTQTSTHSTIVVQTNNITTTVNLLSWDLSPIKHTCTVLKA